MRLAGLGVEILRAAFQWHPSRRQQILTLAQQKLLGTTTDAAMPFVRLLACLVRKEYGILSAHLDQLQVSEEKGPEMRTLIDTLRKSTIKLAMRLRTCRSLHCSACKPSCEALK